MLPFWETTNVLLCWDEFSFLCPQIIKTLDHTNLVFLGFVLAKWAKLLKKQTTARQKTESSMDPFSLCVRDLLNPEMWEQQ